MTRIYLVLSDKIFADMLETELSENGSEVICDGSAIIAPCALITDAENVGRINIPRENCHTVVISDSSAEDASFPAASTVLKRPFETERLLSLLFSDEEKSGPQLRKRSPAEMISYDETKRTVTLGETTVKLSKREFKLFEYLFSEKGVVLSRRRVYDAVWNGEGGENVVDVYVCYLREKLGGAFGVNLIKTYRGKGYVFEE